MGSKRNLLQNELGELLLQHSLGKKRFIDLFSGSGIVATYMAKNTHLEVIGVDLQSYTKVMLDAILTRTNKHDITYLVDVWIPKIKNIRKNSQYWKQIAALENFDNKDLTYVMSNRELCSQKSHIGPVFNAYGGYYFNALQALTIDYMLKYLPDNESDKLLCHAAIIASASQYSASPGHTAQPFNPSNEKGLKHIIEAWSKDPLEYFERKLYSLANEYVNTLGKSVTADALDVCKNLTKDDLVFIDPPYSGVQYSRFYHVLETIARNTKYDVTGVGRYPEITERPQSLFSNVGTSKKALEDLLTALSKTNATVVITYPEKECSNGLSGDYILEIADEYYETSKIQLRSKFSTMGGNNSNRDSHMHYEELILVLNPKSATNKSYTHNVNSLVSELQSPTSQATC